MRDLLPLWGAIGETTVEGQFANFYRTRLQRLSGARCSTRAVREAYLAWAMSAGASTITFKELKRLMVRAGHRHFYSDGACYGDVAILSDGAAIVLDAVRHRADRLAAAGVIERIDRAMAELAELRRLFEEAVP